MSPVACHVRAAAQFHAETGHRHDAHRVAVFLAEQRRRAGCDRFVGGLQLGLNRRVPPDLLVDDRFDLAQLLGGERGVVGEVEPQPVGRHQRAALLDVRPEHLAQRGVQQVGGGVVPARRVAGRVVHGGHHGVTRLQVACGDLDPVKARTVRARLDQSPHQREGASLARERADVRHLAARLDVERRAVERDEAGLAFGQHVDRLPLVVQRGEHRRAVHSRRGVAFEAVGGAAKPGGPRLERRAPGRREAERAAGPRLRLLRLHRLLEAWRVERHAALPGLVLDEVARYPVGFVQPEGVFSAQHVVAGGRAVERLLEARQAVGEHRLEALLLGPNQPDRVVAVASQLRVGVAHLADEHVDQPVEERLADAQALAVAHRAAHDPAQLVAAPLGGRDHAVGDAEARGPRVVCDDAHRHVGGGHAGRVTRAGDVANRRQQRHEQVRVVVRDHTLQNRRDPLEAHAGVDGRRGQRIQRPVRLPVELHEDVVPDLDVAVAVAGDAEADRFRTGEVVAAEVVHLRASPARPGVAHLPEVVGTQFADLPGRQQPAPDRVGLFVARHHGVTLEYRGVQPIRRQRPDVGQQLPGEPDRLGLEVVPEREVAEHLEERVVAQRGADILEVVVLAADPHALLRAGRPAIVAALLAEERVLELVHPGVGEQQRRVVGRHEGRAGDDAVAVPGEVAEERCADLVRGHKGLL